MKEKPNRRWRWLWRTAWIGLGLFAVLLVANAATRTVIRPGDLEQADGKRAEAFALWSEAVTIVNAFLASDFNRSMPRGRFELEPDAMVLVVGDQRLTLRVWNSLAGDLAVWSGAVAQECNGGFRVGSRGGSDPLVDHSWFRDGRGDFRPASRIAKTLAHEAAHAVHRTGNFGVLRSLRNYGEIAFGLKAWDERSFEQAPIGVDHEFWHWIASTDWRPDWSLAHTREVGLQRLDEHVASTDRTCLHGPPERWYLTWDEEP